MILDKSNPNLHTTISQKEYCTMPRQKKSDKITGYSIYDEVAKQKTQQSKIPDLYPELPTKRYDIIYADPPWDYGGKMQFDRSSSSAETLDIRKNIFISSASFQYPTLKTEELKKIPIQEIASDDCLLFMWATSPHLQQAIALGEAWGFEYRTVGFIWDKMIHNPGKYTLSNCELCLIFKRGKIPQPRGARNIQQLVRAARGKHSQKPLEVLKNIELMFPQQSKVELFARRKIEGWDYWGLDVMEETPHDAAPIQKMTQASFFVTEEAI
jgi:N6-adenosine-specific RNA methylase IME4